MRFEENVKVYEKYDKIDDIAYGTVVELKIGDRNYITGVYQGLYNGFAINISGHLYSLSKIQEIKVNIMEESNMSKKEQLLNELEQIKKEFNEKIENVQKQIKEEDNKKECWIPKEKEIYWYVNFNGEAVNTPFGYGHSGDNSRINNLNYYKTKEEAERQSFEELLHRKLKRFADLNNEEEINWNDDNQLKYSIWYDYQDKKLDTGSYDVARDFSQIYFTNEEIAEKAIREFKEDLIRYFTSDK